METVAGLIIGWLIHWWQTPVVVPHTIEYKPKTELLNSYNPVDDCKEDSRTKCPNPSPRIVMTQGGFGQLTDRLIDTRSELKQCIIKVEEHNKAPIAYKGRFE